MDPKKLRILFIGNSHTYVNDLPAIAKNMFTDKGYDCEVTMIAHGGWFLEQHVQEPDVRFNILYGNYDYVVLQEHAHPFGPEEKFFRAVRTICEWIEQAGSKAVIYMTWAQKSEEQVQQRMTKAHEQIAEETGALLAPVGEEWWEQIHRNPEQELYYTDGQHASPAGSALAAKCIVETIEKHRKNA